MRVVWTWHNVGNGAVSEIDGHKLRIALTLASVRTWEQWYPEDERVFYCDREAYDFFINHNWDFWTKYEILDFNKLFGDRGLDKTPCWGLARNYVAAIQKEPFLTVDCDTVVFGDFKQYLDLSKPWVNGGYYDFASLDKEKATTLFSDNRIKEFVGGWKQRGYNMAYTYFPTVDLIEEWGEKCLFLTKKFYDLGCFNNKTVLDSNGGNMWHYAMLLDEGLVYEIFNKYYKKEDIQVFEAVQEVSKLTKHHTKKWEYDTLKEYLSTVKYYLRLANLPEDSLDFLKYNWGYKYEGCLDLEG